MRTKRNRQRCVNAGQVRGSAAWLGKQLLEGILPEIGRYLLVALLGGVLPWLIKWAPWLALLFAGSSRG